MSETSNLFSEIFEALSDSQEIEALKNGLSLAKEKQNSCGGSLKGLCDIYAELFNAFSTAESDFDAEKFGFAKKYIGRLIVESAMLECGYEKNSGQYSAVNN